MSFSPARIEDSGDVVVDDLLQGMNEWRNIQVVIRTTFKALHDVIKSQGETIRNLERQVETKANKTDLAKKANISDVNRSLSEITRSLESKAEFADLEAKLEWKSIESALDSKVSNSELQAVKETLVHQRDLFQFKEICDSQFRSLSTQLSEKIDASACRSSVEAIKVTVGDSVALIQRKIAENREDIEVIRSQIKTEQSNRKVDEKAVDEIRVHMQRLASRGEVADAVSGLDDKVEKAELENILAKNNERIAAMIESTAARIESAEKRRSNSTEDKIISLDRDLSTRLTLQEKDLSARLSHIDLKHSERADLLTSTFDEKIVRLQKEVSGLVLHDRQRMEGNFEQVRDEVDKLLNASIQHLEGLVNQTVRKEDILSALAKKADKSNLEDVSEYVMRCDKEIERLQYELDQVRRENDVMNTSSDHIDQKTESNSIAIKAIRRSVEEINSQISGLSSNIGTLSNNLTTVSSNIDVCETRMVGHDTRISILDEKINANASSSATVQRDMSHKIAEMQRDLLLKADLKDLNSILDSKANIEDINRSLMHLSSALEDKCSQRQLDVFVEEQGVINSALGDCAIGRWIWQSGLTKANNYVPWNLQSLNTDPENLIWDRDKTSIIVKEPGLYEISFGFYSRKKPVVQVLVNGEPIFMISNQASLSGSARLTPSHKHSSGNVAGLTHIDYIALPAKAKIALSYACESKAEGFLGLRKL